MLGFGFYVHSRRRRFLGSLSSNDTNADYFVIVSSSHPLLLNEHVANGMVEAPLK